MRRPRSFSLVSPFSVGLVFVLAVFIALAGCTQKNDQESLGRQAVVDEGAGPAGNDEGDADTHHCLEAFNYLSSRCGAQFLDSAGGVIGQNDLVEACGEPKVRCIVDCYDKSRDCATIGDCLEADCGL